LPVRKQGVLKKHGSCEPRISIESDFQTPYFSYKYENGFLFSLAAKSACHYNDPHHNENFQILSPPSQMLTRN
jgi:hypothetical protein